MFGCAGLGNGALLVIVVGDRLPGQIALPEIHGVVDLDIKAGRGLAGDIDGRLLDGAQRAPGPVEHQMGAQRIVGIALWPGWMTLGMLGLHWFRMMVELMEAMPPSRLME